jgi:hypothetical protein
VQNERIRRYETTEGNSQMGYIEIKCSGSGERRKKAWIGDWRPFFIQSFHKQIVGRGATMGFQQPSF